jgi:hypothetical protein
MNRPNLLCGLRDFFLNACITKEVGKIYCKAVNFLDRKNREKYETSHSEQVFGEIS